MTNQDSNLTDNQRYLRGLLFVSAGAFMVIRIAGGDHPVFEAAAWFTALVALVAFVMYVWTLFQEVE